MWASYRMGHVLALIVIVLLTRQAWGQTPGAAFRDCTDCPEMVVIPAGSFTMGSPASEAGRDSDEGPQRVVTIARAFAVGRYEVTRGQFAAFARDTGHVADEDCNWRTRNAGAEGAANGDHPVVCVSWNDAKAYVGWLSKKTGRQYRLLTEAEWEYAARAGSTTRYPWGNDPAPACAHANVGNCPGRSGTTKVGSYPPNAFGLSDMIGNAWEWTEDCWNDSYAARLPMAARGSRATAPGGCIVAVVGPISHGSRVRLTAPGPPPSFGSAASASGSPGRSEILNLYVLSPRTARRRIFEGICDGRDAGKSAKRAGGP